MHSNGPYDNPPSTEMKYDQIDDDLTVYTPRTRSIPLNISEEIECDLIVGSNPYESPSSTLYGDNEPGHSIIFALCFSDDILNDIALFPLSVNRGDPSIFCRILIFTDFQWNSHLMIGFVI